MSNRWPGGVIRKTPVTPAGPFQNGAASGVWTLADAAYWTKQGLWPLAGNTLAVEDVFSTWLYTGTSATQTITNGINLSGSGGLVWIKPRDSALGHNFFDTIRGPLMRMQSDNTDASTTVNNSLTGFTSSGFTLGSAGGVNNNGTSFASWTFREQPNFFDVVTYTGTGANQNIAHNLGSVPGMILVKRTDTAADWQVYHRSNANTQYQVLNSTAAVATGTTRWNSTTPTSSVFTVGTDATVNASGGTYVAYLFAHDTASTGIIQCGSFTADGSGNATVSLGWEPQWVTIKNSGSSGNWITADNMRGFPVGTTGSVYLAPNLAAVEANLGGIIQPTSTGFSGNSFAAGATIIYIAIRRGPMKTPTLGTSVFLPLATSSAVDTAITTNFPVDLMISGQRNSNNATDNWAFIDRLRGATASTNTAGSSQKRIKSTSTNAEDSPTYPYAYNWWNTGLVQGYGLAGASQIYYTLRRAPGFFDEVCYTGTGSAGTITHNLGVVPELVITKGRGSVTNWGVYTAALGPTKALLLNTTNAEITSANYWNNTAPTATQVSLGATTNSSTTFVAYLFASAPGVSKVGSYTGTGALQTINCAFTTGARFVLIKRTDTTGDWYVWDSARGISSGTDPYLLLNDLSAEVTGTNYVDTDTTGFKVTAAAPAGINASGGTYIFLAIA
jgi:hypothetical protein